LALSLGQWLDHSDRPVDLVVLVRLEADEFEPSCAGVTVHQGQDEAGIAEAAVQPKSASQELHGCAPAALAYLARPVAARWAIPRYRSYCAVARNDHDRLTLLTGRFPRAVIHQVLHHRAHGLTAFAASGWEEVAVLVVDSLGETQTTAIARGHLDGAVSVGDLALEVKDPASLGYAYGAVTQHLGWRKADEEGTVIALAALGDPQRSRVLFTEAIPLTAHRFALDLRLFPLRVLSCRWPRVSAEFAARTARRAVLARSRRCTWIWRQPCESATRR
jgi:carbamoyltransferase